MGWKIVRDKDPEHVPARGVSGRWRPSTDPIAGLTKKLFEEAAEFAESADPGELYDLLDVTQELIARLDLLGDHLNDHTVKVAERGKFTQAIEWNPVP